MLYGEDQMPLPGEKRQPFLYHFAYHDTTKT